MEPAARYMAKMFQTENVLVTSMAELIYNLGSREGQILRRAVPCQSVSQSELPHKSALKRCFKCFQYQ